MRKFRSSLFVLIVAGYPLGSLLAETASEKPSVDVRRVGSHIGCKCGCTDTVATCAMLECSFSKPAKERIAKLQAAGLSDKTIIDQFVTDFGASVYRGNPNAVGWIVPYILLAPGLALIFWFIRRYRKPRPVPDVVTMEDANLARYREQIEKNLAHLE
jgi:cytochrome c-type biogenesis protein CcmH/NrfF